MLLGDIALQPRDFSYYEVGGNNDLHSAESSLGNNGKATSKNSFWTSGNNNNNGVGIATSSPRRKDNPVTPASEPSGWDISNTSDGKAVATSPKKEINPEAPTNWGGGAISEGSREPERPPMSKELIDQIVNRPIEPTTGYVQSDGTVGYEPEQPGDKEIKEAEEAEAIDRIKTAALAEDERRVKESGIKDSGTNDNKTTTKEPVRISENNDNNAFAASQINTGINRTPEQVVMSSAGGGARANRSTLANKAVFGGMSNSAHPGYSLFGGV